MNASQIVELMNRTPFVPIEIRMNNGSAIHVEQPFDIAARPNSSDCLIFEGDRWRFIAYRTIAEVITSSVNGS
jgi:outer membrane lipoprotein SlyB